MSFLTSIRQEFSGFCRSERLFILFSMLSGLCIGFEYAVTRPASNALFITTFSAAAIPWAWLATVPLNFCILYLYSRFLPKIGPLRMLSAMVILAMGINLLAALILSYFPEFIFFHFIWKDIYILFMFKQLWSMIHTTIPEGRAKYLYGLIFGMGTLGGIIGSLVPGFFAVEMGSERLFLFTLPLYSLLLFSYLKAFRFSKLNGVAFTEILTKDPRPQEGISLIFRNRYLVSILFLVVFMQVSVALAEYQFNTHLQLTVFDKDLRTAYYGQIFGLTNMVSLFLQFFGTFVLVRLLGVKGCHLAIPLFLFLNALASSFLPGFALVAFSFVLVKSLDFSVFGVVREMLYIPLSLDEKYRAKAVIDVFVWRTSKALVSIALLSLQFLAISQVLQLASILSLVLALAWTLFALFFFRRVYTQTTAKM